MKPKVKALLLWIAMMSLSGTSTAEQMKKLGRFEVHYVVVPTTFFSTVIAERYDIVRGKDRAMMNVSVLDNRQRPTRVDIKGRSTNLLGQTLTLDFREIVEGEAVYYLAPLKHGDQEVLRFDVEFRPMGAGEGEQSQTLRFQQKMYWEGQ